MVSVQWVPSEWNDSLAGGMGFLVIGYSHHTNRKNEQRFENVSCENFFYKWTNHVTGWLETIFHMLFTVFHHAIVHDLVKINYYD